MNSKDERQTIRSDEERSDFEIFCDKLISRLECYYGDNYSITISSVNKNNGIIRHALLIREDVCNLSPSIYIDKLYEDYSDGTSFAEIIREIIDIRNENDYLDDFDVDFVKNYELVRQRLGMKLVSRELNRELLTNAPYIEFADLALVFFIMVTEIKVGEASILIKNELFDEWNVTVTELHHDAKENMMRMYPPVRSALVDMVGDLLGVLKLPEANCPGETDIPYDLQDEIGNNCMYVLTNQARWYGATCMAYTDMLKCIADSFESDFYILPSSIHEIILIPVGSVADISRGFLTSMVREVNAAEISEEEILSDHAYLYHRANNWLESLE